MGLVSFMKNQKNKVIVPVATSILLFTPGLGAQQELTNFDVQAGYFETEKGSKSLLEKLTELNLPAYRVDKDDGYKVVVDTNTDYSNSKEFIDEYLEDTGAFPVESTHDVVGSQIKEDSIFNDRFTYAPELTESVSFTFEGENAVKEDGASNEKLDYVSKERFIEIMEDYIQSEYKSGCFNRSKKNLPDKRARQYATWIYEASEFYDMDPFVLLAVANHETYFRNMNGDLNYQTNGKRNHSEGMFQMIKTTQRHTYLDMKRKGLDERLSWRPGFDLKRFPKDQAYMAAHFLKHVCGEEKGLQQALQRYNGSSKYPPKVMQKITDARNFYNENIF